MPRILAIFLMLVLTWPVSAKTPPLRAGTYVPMESPASFTFTYQPGMLRLDRPKSVREVPVLAHYPPAPRQLGVLVTLEDPTPDPRLERHLLVFYRPGPIAGTAAFHFAHVDASQAQALAEARRRRLDPAVGRKLETWVSPSLREQWAELPTLDTSDRAATIQLYHRMWKWMLAQMSQGGAATRSLCLALNGYNPSTSMEVLGKWVAETQKSQDMKWLWKDIDRRLNQLERRGR